MKKIWILSSLIMLIITLYQINSAYAKYHTEAEGTVEETIGAWIVKVNGTNIATEEERFLSNIVENEYKRLTVKMYNGETTKDELEEIKVILDLKEFNKLDNVIKSRLILYTISKVYGKVTGIEKIHIDDIIKLCNNNIGNKYLTPNKNLKVLVKDRKIFFISQKD